MDERAQILHRITVAVLETLEETPQGGPASSVTLALSRLMDHSVAIRFVDALVSGGFIDRTPAHWLTITPKGRAILGGKDAAP